MIYSYDPEQETTQVQAPIASVTINYHLGSSLRTRRSSEDPRESLITLKSAETADFLAIITKSRLVLGDGKVRKDSLSFRLTRFLITAIPTFFDTIKPNRDGSEEFRGFAITTIYGLTTLAFSTESTLRKSILLSSRLDLGNDSIANRQILNDYF